MWIFIIPCANFVSFLSSLLLSRQILIICMIFLVYHFWVRYLYLCFISISNFGLVAECLEYFFLDVAQVMHTPIRWLLLLRKP